MIVVCLLAVVCASRRPVPVTKTAIPSTPSFPNAFSSTARFEEVENIPHFARLFVDFPNQRQRVDFWDDHTQGRVAMIENYSTHTRYIVAGQADEIECWYRAFQGTLTPPNFKMFQFWGVANVHGVPADHWGFVDRAHEFDAEYFDRTDTFEPLAWNWRNGTQSGRFEYFEMDIGPQESQLFSPSYEWPAVTCNAAPGVEFDGLFGVEKHERDSFGLFSMPNVAKTAWSFIAKKRAAKQA